MGIVSAADGRDGATKPERGGLALAPYRGNGKQVEAVADPGDRDAATKPPLSATIGVEPPSAATVDRERQPRARAKQPPAQLMARP